MRVLLFEQWRGGHYFNYIESLLPRLSEIAGEVVVALTPRAFESEEFQVKLAHFQMLGNVRFEISIPDADPALPARERLRLLLNLRDAIKAIRPDYVLLPSADSQTMAMGILGHAGIKLLPINIPTEATFHYGYGPAIASVKHIFKEFAYRLAYAGCTWSHLNFVNFLYYEYGRRHHCRWFNRAKLVPDPVPSAPRTSRIVARRMLGIPDSGRYAGLLGSLDSRKAIPELLAAFRAAKMGATDRLLLAGRLDPGFRALIQRDYRDLQSSGRLVVIDRFLKESELLQGFSALDLVCPVYRDFPGLASLLLKGVSAGRPVITHDFGWSRALVKRFGVGSAVNVHDTPHFAKKLKAAFEESPYYEETEATRRLLSFHDPSNFVDTMLENVCRMTGKSSSKPILTWEWVLDAVDPAIRDAY